MAHATATSQAEPHDREGIKDTLESIVVALILAFVFRAFIVEAFVIPTGSMAPTLYGAHGTIVCEDCGVEFAYGVRDLADQRGFGHVRANSGAVCPNCNHTNTHLRVNDDNRNREKGDRILVLKWPLDIGGSWLEPARWDVIVFKDPADGVTNFIKRLVGLPNEVLSIIDGDAYTVSTDVLSASALSELDRIRHEKYELRAGLRRGRLRPVPADVLDELDANLTIARKTDRAQESLWFTVYDHDFPPQTLGENQPRWITGRAVETGWDTSRRTVRFEGQGHDDDYITLAGKEIRATCAYNIRGGRPVPVSDMRIRFVLTPDDAKGVITIRLEKHDRVFWATLEMDGRLALLESPTLPGPDAPTMAAATGEPFVPGRPVEVSFENVDYRLALHVGGDEVLASGSDPSSPAYYAPDVHELRRKHRTTSVPPRIYGTGGSFTLTHLVLERDIHYFHDPAFRALSLNWAPRSGWASADSPILLRDDEYFMLGDNTTASKDSRLWDEFGAHLTARGEAFQLGTVPRDQLIGKAFFVYWPSGFPIEWLPRVGNWNWSVIPDVGRMRWIR